MIKVAVIGVMGAVLALVLKEGKGSHALLIILVSCLLLLGLSLTRIQAVIASVTEMSQALGEGKLYLAVLLKMIGIAYVAEFGSDLCRDAGAAAIAGQIEFFGKIMLLAVSMPIMQNLIDLIGTMGG